MKKFAFAFVLMAMALVSCQDEIKQMSFEDEVSSEQFHLRMAESDYEKVVVEPLVKADGYKFHVSGIIEYYLNGELVATVDYGDGNLDDYATKTVDGVTKKIDLAQKKNGKDGGYEDGDEYEEEKTDFEKVVIEPIVKSSDCDYIVAGIIEYHLDGEWWATVDFGDGTCDDIADKTAKEKDGSITESQFIISDYYK